MPQQFSYQVFVQEILYVEIVPEIFLPENPTRKFAGENLPGKSHQENSNLKVPPENLPGKLKLQKLPGKFSWGKQNCKCFLEKSKLQSHSENAKLHCQTATQNCIANCMCGIFWKLRIICVRDFLGLPYNTCMPVHAYICTVSRPCSCPDNPGMCRNCEFRKISFFRSLALIL